MRDRRSGVARLLGLGLARPGRRLEVRVDDTFAPLRSLDGVSADWGSFQKRPSLPTPSSTMKRLCASDRPAPKRIMA
jgi:hypothetical protein